MCTVTTGETWVERLASPRNFTGVARFSHGQVQTRCQAQEKRHSPAALRQVDERIDSGIMEQGRALALKAKGELENPLSLLESHEKYAKSLVADFERQRRVEHGHGVIDSFEDFCFLKKSGAMLPGDLLHAGCTPYSPIQLEVYGGFRKATSSRKELSQKPLARRKLKKSKTAVGSAQSRDSSRSQIHRDEATIPSQSRGSSRSQIHRSEATIPSQSRGSGRSQSHRSEATMPFSLQKKHPQSILNKSIVPAGQRVSKYESSSTTLATRQKSPDLTAMDDRNNATKSRGPDPAASSTAHRRPTTNSTLTPVYPVDIFRWASARPVYGVSKNSSSGTSMNGSSTKPSISNQRSTRLRAPGSSESEPVNSGFIALQQMQALLDKNSSSGAQAARPQKWYEHDGGHPDGVPSNQLRAMRQFISESDRWGRNHA